MKNLPLLLAMTFALIVSSCQSDKKSGADSQDNTETATPADQTTQTPANGLFEGAEEISTIPHYICPNGCANSGGSQAGTCPVCGTAYQHNDAFHTADQNAELPPPTPSTPEPAQNAKGVWHYTCANGCAGGSGQAEPCPSCGTMLSHNAAYHNP